MAGKTKFKLTMFLVYDYDKEEDYINSMSRKGWQLKKGGMLHHTYERDDQNYRYRLDFNNKVNFNPEEQQRYLSIFREQGWEHINSTLNGWHYFRKKYDSQLNEDEYEIYTDDSSLKEMLGKWIRIARGLEILLLLLLICYIPVAFTTKNPLAIMDCIVDSSAFLLMQLAIWHMKKKRVNARTKSVPVSIAGYILVFIMFFTIFLILFLDHYEPCIYKVAFQINPGMVNHVDTLTLNKNGEYGLFIRCKSNGGGALVRITKNNDIIFRSAGEASSDGWLNLPAGEYRIETFYYPEDYDENYNFDYSKQNAMNNEDSTSGMVDVQISIKKRFIK